MVAEAVGAGVVFRTHQCCKIGLSGLCQRFLQHDDLPGVVEVVLDDAVEQGIDRIVPTGVFIIDDRVEVGVRHTVEGVAQPVVAGFKRGQRIVPGRLARVGYRGKVHFWRDVDRKAFEDLLRRVFPGCDVQDEFPDAVRVGQGMRRRLLRCDVGEDLAQRRPMPGFTLVGAFKLIEDPFGFFHARGST